VLHVGLCCCILSVMGQVAVRTTGGSQPLLPSAVQRQGGILFLLALVCCAGLAQTQPRLTPYEQAAAYVQQGQPLRAIVLLQQVLAKSPDDVEAHNLLGVAFTASGMLKEANAHFSQAIKLNPRFYPALRNLGLNELEVGHLADAKAHLQQVLEYSRQDRTAHLALGEVYFEEKEFAPAVDHYLKSEGLFLRSPEFILHYATSCLESNQGYRAAGALELLGPQVDARTHFQAGAMLARLEKYEAAARQFELARKDYDDPYEVGFNLTLAYVKSQKYPDAIRTAQELISQKHVKSELYNLLSEAYERNGQTVEAYDALRTATEIDPKDEKNYLDLMGLGVDHANFKLALDIADIGLRNIPNSFRLIMQRGTVLAFNGQYTAALRDFEAAAQLDPRSNMPYFGITMALMLQDQGPRALEILHQRLTTYPDDYLLLYALGESADHAGNSGGVSQDEALRAFERSVQLNANFAPSRVALGRMYFRRNKLDLAIPQLERALELNPNDLSPCYELAQAYRRKGDNQRANESMAKFEKFRDEDRKRSTNHDVLQLIRQGEQ